MAHLHELQNEKILQLQNVNHHINTIHELSLVMSFDFFETVNDAHPSLSDPTIGQSKSINNDMLTRLTSVIRSLKQEKQQRLQKDDNRYSVRGGAHKNLKREEKARILKRLQDQFAAEQEAKIGSKPATKRSLGPNTTTNMVGTPIGRRAMTPSGLNTISIGKDRRESNRVAIPLNYVALPKDDQMSRGG
ncbi:hypothetical protein Ddye_029238 [Dipteronia dyeriana]|uniref:Uncharacterized protein n=1 Tax=Dipteronia dyeriana TaxID=168575 RepID=A0AAD9TEU7_9ROSI|nr:hypothetical protein Ddye_029238 [Dipteronia dyeriana]